MNYIGSKYKLSAFLLQNIEHAIKRCGAKPLDESIFCDLFAGTSAVGRLFKNRAKQVISNDREFYSFVLAKNYIQNSKELIRVRKLLELLDNENTTLIQEGKIYKYYALGGGENRQYFSDENAKKIDSIRIQIKAWKDDDFINEEEYFVLLASLLESADKVANTASVYGAFLKTLKKTAQKKLVLKPADFEISENTHIVFNEDSNILIKQIRGDILYLDPPYNTREYGANYHLLNSIALYDDFVPRGKTGLREYEKSNWCKKAKVYNELENLIKNANFNLIFLSYNNEGLLNLEQIGEIFKKYGKYSLKSQAYQRFKADSKRIQKQNKTIEYLHILEK